MRIKFNDKIYRLKEIESGVDSLMELVEEPKYNHGDFLVSKAGHPFILDREGRNGESYYLFAISIYDPDVKSIQDSGGKLYCGYLKDAIAADHKAIRAIHDGLKSIGKRWNDDKKCIEDIPKRKFKAGDKVKIKDGISSDTHGLITEDMDKLIGERLIVIGYNSMSVLCSSEVEGFCHNYLEDWLEPYTDEPKKGDLAIFWDDHDIDYSSIRMYDRKGYSGYYDSFGIPWDNAIKFESKEQFEKVLRGEI